jgi:hypothetical protein
VIGPSLTFALLIGAGVGLAITLVTGRYGDAAGYAVAVLGCLALLVVLHRRADR